MEGSIMAVGLFEEAQARNHSHEDWERDYRRLQERADITEFFSRIKGLASRIAAAFSRPGSQPKVVEA